PDAQLAGAAGGQLGDGKLDHDGEHVEARHVVVRLSRGAEGTGGRRVRKLGQRTAHRLAVGEDPEEMLQIDEKGVVARTGKRLQPTGAAEVGVECAGHTGPAGGELVGHRAEDRRRDWTAHRYPLRGSRAGEADLDDLVFPRVTGVVDLELIELIRV